MNNYEVIFESENILYVKLSENLIDDYLKMVNDPDISKFISHHPKKYSYEDEQQWVKNQLDKNAICFSMIEKKSSEYIGNIEIMEIKNNIGELGISITKDKQNKHYGYESIKAIIKYGSEKLNLQGMDLNVYDTNLRAIHCYEKVGFIKAGEGKSNGDIHMEFQMNKENL